MRNDRVATAEDGAGAVRMVAEAAPATAVIMVGATTQLETAVATTTL